MFLPNSKLFPKMFSSYLMLDELFILDECFSEQYINGEEFCSLELDKNRELKNRLDDSSHRLITPIFVEPNFPLII